MNFISLLEKWYERNMRILPWRETINPYNIWISEIILQQTKVVQGYNYYINFIDQFPDIESLAKSTEDEVLNLWKGLGYYSRAHNLHSSAKYIFYTLDNQFPNSYNEILKLKGVGRYTSAAIASISFKEKVPAIDGNAFRVYSRIFNLEKDISKASTFTYLFNLLKPLMPENPGNFNQAIMDLGSSLCIPLKPKCELCPLKIECLAYKYNKQEYLPIKKSVVKVKKEQIKYAYISCGNEFLIQKRDNSSIWKGLYEFPNYKKAIFENIKTQNVYKIKHKLSHRELDIIISEIVLEHENFSKIAKNIKAKIINKNDINKYAFPKPLENYLHYN